MHVPKYNVYKIGVSKNAKSRLKYLQTASAYKIELVKFFTSDFAYKIETALHRQLAYNKADIDQDELIGEWFNLDKSFIDDFEKRCNILEQAYNSLKEAKNIFFK